MLIKLFVIFLLGVHVMPFHSKFVRSPNNYDTREHSKRSGIVIDDECLVQQQFRDDCDINVIVERFGVTGKLPAVPVRAPQYGDFTGVADFHSAVNAVALANESFDQLPAQVRYRFNNDPQKFLEFCEDSSNIEEARKLGIAMPDKGVQSPQEAGSSGGSTPTPKDGAKAAKAPLKASSSNSSGPNSAVAES